MSGCRRVEVVELTKEGILNVDCSVSGEGEIVS